MTTTRRERELEQGLKALVQSVELFIELLDEAMKQPPDHDRGHRVAVLSNGLELAKDLARFGPLGLDYRTGKKRRAPVTP